MSVSGYVKEVQSHLGYKEHGDNLTKFGEEFGWNGVAWCDEFACVCGKHAGERAAVGWYAGTEAHEKWFKVHNRLTKARNNIERGQLIFWDWNKNGSPNHVEVVTSVDTDKNGNVVSVVTVGGNTGPGSAYVYRQRRSLTYWLSCGRPLFSDWETAWPGKLLVVGSHNDAVGRMQKKLGFTGHDVDNVFGKMTKAKVLSFQKAHKLTADGEVGSKTWGALF